MDSSLPNRRNLAARPVHCSCRLCDRRDESDDTFEYEYIEELDYPSHFLGRLSISHSRVHMRYLGLAVC